MAQNITLLGASYSDVPAVELPKTGGGTAKFDDTTDANATASDILSGKTAYVNGVKITGTGTGGGGSSVQIGTATVTLSSRSNAIEFENLLGEPTSFCISSVENITANNTVAEVVFDNSNIITQCFNSSGAFYEGATYTVSTDVDWVQVETNTDSEFQAGDYKIVYTYGGSSACINTADVQVGSGATSITFTGLDDEPLVWSCVFKSNFSTSSGYQRVMGVVYDGTNTYGMELDSNPKYSNTHWTATYNNGSLTITSQGTNAGGYFHQPGYYQLTYVIDVNGNYQSKTVTPTTSAQEVTADTGYDALKKVTVNAIPSEYIVPSGNINITSNTATGQTLNVAQYATATVAVPTSGTSKNVQVLQSTSRTNSSSLTKVLGDLTVSKTGTYDIYWSGGRTNTSTSYTWGTRLYVDGTGYGTENTTWSNNCQSNHLSNVSLTANQKLSVYARGRSGSYYTFAPMLVIVEA